MTLVPAPDGTDARDAVSGGALDGLIDLLFPRRCVVCRAAGGWLCERCAGDLRPLPAWRCARCGAPFRASRLRPGAAGRTLPARLRPPCPECRDRDLDFVAASAAFCYEGPARALVTACKFRALRSLAEEMALLAAPAFAAACSGAAETAAAGSAGRTGLVVTSVPAHRGHRLERGFDPAEVFARGLARDAGVTYAPLLRRLRHGARQSGLARAARAANVRHAFALRENDIGVRINPKRVIVVDDVYTTGETLNQCAAALAQAGLQPLVFTFARTVRASSLPTSREPSVSKERCR